ncbi:putative ribonuclease H-like domain-containing protein [Tanacetum coccineum]
MYDHPTDGIFTNASCDDEDAVVDFTNLETIVSVSPIPTSRINSIHPSTLILGDPNSSVQTRSKVTKSFRAHAFVSYIQKQRRNNHKDFQNCLFACFLSQNEPKKISEALEDESWVDAMQEELLQFKIQKVWILVDLPYGKKAIRTKWVYRNKKDERGVMVRNKERIEAVRIFLAFASYMGFIVYQMDVKSAFLYRKIDEEVYVSQPPGFVDPKYPKKVYKVVKAFYGLHQALRAWYATLSTFLLKSGYRRGTINKTLFIKKDKNDIELVQDKYVAEILKKFDFASVKTASTPIETQKPLVKDEEASDVDVYLYRSMISSLMYLTASRPDILFAVCACSRVSSFDLEAYSDSDYAGANLDRKSTTGEVEYVASANCCGKVLWIQNQMLDYGFNFMNTKIYIDNESTICIVKNPVFHSKTKHIAIRHHFIRDAYEKKLIQVLKIHTDDNVTDLLTKAFDVNSYLGFRESLERDIDGTEELLLLDLFILWLTKVSTDSAKLIPLGKDSTAIETLEKIPPRTLLIAFFYQTLIFYSSSLINSSSMVVLESCPKHNMVAYLEKTDGNIEFHEIISFLMRNSIHYALTVSHVVSTTFIEQFWMSAKSKIINNVRYITAKVAGKPVSISEASIRSDLLFDDADGIDSLPNQAIFDAVQLMGYEGDLIGRKPAKAEPTVPKDPAFDELDDDTMDYMETKDAQDDRRG